jgi:hypothetical protein
VKTLIPLASLEFLELVARARAARRKTPFLIVEVASWVRDKKCLPNDLIRRFTAQQAE